MINNVFLARDHLQTITVSDSEDNKTLFAQFGSCWNNSTKGCQGKFSWLMSEWNLTSLELWDYGLCSFSTDRSEKEKKKEKKSCTLANMWVNLWLMIFVAMTKPTQWFAGNFIYNTHTAIYLTCTKKKVHTKIYLKRHMSRHKSSRRLQPGFLLDHAFHPHPLSKKPEVNSFPYSLSLSHPAPSYISTGPITPSGANSC